jgi:predicted phosphodiesterase
LKIAILSDAHSNIHSLQAVLDDIASEKPDAVVAAGDMVGCSAYAGAVRVWQTLQDENIPCVLGNEEARIISFSGPAPDPYHRSSVQFMPLQYRAGQFSGTDIAAMESLPFQIVLDGTRGQDVLVCHASPRDLYRSPMLGIDHHMERDLMETPASVIAMGHLHARWHRVWQGKLLVMAGSAGLPLRHKLDEVDYLVLTHHKDGWLIRYRTVRYDYRAAIREVLESDFLDRSGPLGWLMLDEILTQEDRLVPFLGDFCPDHKPDDIDGWKSLVTAYLVRINRWEAVRPYIQRGVPVCGG